MTNLRSLQAEFQRSAQNPFRQRESGSSGGISGRASSSSQTKGTGSSGKSSSKPPSHRSTKSSAGNVTEAARKGSSAGAAVDKPSRTTYSAVKTSVTLRAVASPAAAGSVDVSSKGNSPSGGDSAAPYTQSLRPSQIISGPGGVHGSSRILPMRAVTVTPRTPGNASTSPSSEAEAAAAAAARAARAAAAASSGSVVSPPGQSGSGADSTRILSRRPTMTIKAAREAREAKAKAAAEARAAREAGK